MQRLKLIVIISLLFAFLTITTVAQEKEKSKNLVKYVGEYVVEDNGFTKVRYIKLKKEKLYYIAGDLEIPLKPVTDTKFNLYPSQTYIDFSESKEEMTVTITKGSGAIIFGKRVNNDSK